MTIPPAVIRAHAARLPLPDASVDLIVTSPPYFGLRSYTDGGEHYPGQIGSEGTPGEWLDALWACTAEWVRVLKPEGNLFVNLGDKYSQRVATRPSSHQDGLFPNRPELRKDWKRDRTAGLARMPYENIIDAETGAYVAEKCLMGLPWRYAIGCTDHLGLILRAEIIWAKPNGLPESVTDRVRRAHEQVFHFTRQPRYYSAVDEIREPQVRQERPCELENRWTEHARAARSAGNGAPGHRPHTFNPLGKLPGSVWPIPSQPLQVPASLGVDHFAAFPMELPRRIILGWSPPGVCTGCGQGRRPIVDRERTFYRLSQSGLYGAEGHTDRVHRARADQDGRNGGRASTTATITGYTCACGFESSDGALPRNGEPAGRPGKNSLPPTRPAVVLDPFGGTGTTALVATVLGRHGITADLSADYCRLAAWRCADPGERARAMQVPKPPPVVDGQEALFAL